MSRLWKRYKDIPFVIKITTGFILGAIVGITFGTSAGFLSPFGTLLLNLLSLIAIPVIFLTVVLAVNQMNITQLGRIGGKLILYYAATTAAAVLIGLSLALWFNPGKGLETFKVLLTFTGTFYLGLIILWVVVYAGSFVTSVEMACFEPVRFIRV